jgi:glycogen operon protein
MATLLLSQGVPMILAGDEFLRSQQGNNNAWCQDNEVSWVNWRLAEENADFLRFVREMIALRKRHPALRRRGFFEGKDPKRPQKADIIWHGVDPETPDFSERSLTLAYALNGRETGREPDSDFYVACNASADPMLFRIPPSPTGRPWHGVVDTALRSPNDFLPECTGPLILPMAVYPVAPHTLIVLISTP